MSGTGNPPQPPSDQEEQLDESIEESFPASDPPAHTPVRRPAGEDRHADEAKGTPHTDRHASETAAGRQEGTRPAESKSE